MSSRNRYLSPDDRKRAALLSQSLSEIRSAFDAGEHDGAQLLNAGRAILATDENISIDYLALVDPLSFDPLLVAHSGSAVILAARVGGTRLLDNIIL
jgi:pantothenate synthetase